MLRLSSRLLLRTVDKIESPLNYPSRNPLPKGIFFNILHQLIAYINTMRYLESKMKAFRNMCGSMCSTKPASHLTHLEEAQSLVEKPHLVPGKRPTRRCTGSKLPWITSTIISTSIALFLLVTRPSLNCASTSPEGSFETGFSTDLGRRPGDLLG